MGKHFQKMSAILAGIGFGLYGTEGQINVVKQNLPNLQCQTNHQLITTVVPSIRGTYQAQFPTENSLLVKSRISVFENIVPD